MGQTTFSIQMDENTKKGLDFYCAVDGMNSIAVINMFAEAVIRNKRIPHEFIGRDNICGVPAEQPGKSRETVLARGRAALAEAQEQSIANGTSEMTLDDINEMISACRHGS